MRPNRTEDQRPPRCLGAPARGRQRFGNDSQPGEWEPWILYVGGVWALVIAIFAVRVGGCRALRR